jgi:hypothetical protein
MDENKTQKGMTFRQWLTKYQLRVKLPLQAIFAEVAEQADALRSGRSGLYAHVGSTPTFGTHRDKTGPRVFGSVFY